MSATELRERILVYEKVREEDENGQVIEKSRKLKCEFLGKVTHGTGRESPSGELWENTDKWIVETWFWPTIKKDDIIYIPEYDVWVDIDAVTYSKPFMRLEGVSRESV